MGKRKTEEKEFDIYFDDEPQEKIVVVQDEGREPASVTVTVVNWDLGDVACVRDEAWHHKLIGKSHLINTYGAQSIPFQVFIDGIAPYDWSDEINAVALTPDQMRDILYAQGYVVKQNLSLAELAKVTLVRGKIPATRR